MPLTCVFALVGLLPAPLGGVDRLDLPRSRVL